MTVYLLYMLAALYLGILTSISPCPLATNIAAISYIGRKVESPRAIIVSGLLYTAGRCLLYMLLAVIVASMTLSIPAVSLFLQKYMHIVLGPIFLLLGMFLLGLLVITGSANFMTESMQQRIDRLGVWGALPMGALFAISFCPTSAAFFFGLLALIMGGESGLITAMLAKIGLVLPEASLSGASFLLPLCYGVATGLPVLLVAYLLAFSAQSVGKAYSTLGHIEGWARKITGCVFLLLGLWFSFKYVLFVG